MFSEGRQLGLQWAGPAFWSGRQSAEAADCSARKDKHLHLPCFCGRGVVALTEHGHGPAGPTQSPIWTFLQHQLQHMVWGVVRSTFRAVLPLAQTPRSWQSPSQSFARQELPSEQSGLTGKWLVWLLAEHS